jgi:hypothetical protein
VIPQKQGAAQSFDPCNRVLIASLACVGSRVIGGVNVRVGVKEGENVREGVIVGGTGVGERVEVLVGRMCEGNNDCVPVGESGGVGWMKLQLANVKTNKMR